MQKLKGVRFIGGKWQARLTCPVTGRHTDYTVASREEAIAARNDVANAKDARKRGRLIIPPNVEDILRWVVSRGTEGFKQEEPKQIQTVYELLDEFLQMREVKMNGGKLTAYTIDSETRLLGIFRRYCQKNDFDLPSQALSETALDGYKAVLEQRYKSSNSQRLALTHVKAFVKWAWKLRKLDDLPRNLDDFGRVDWTKPEPKVFTKDEVRALYIKAKPRMRLYILMGVNLGYRQEDLSSLEKTMIDYATGLISRDRHKTSVPQPGKLWKITQDLLKVFQTKSNHPTLAVLTKHGKPIVFHSRSKSGNLNAMDSIKAKFAHLLRQCGITGHSFKDFRSTSATLLMNEYRPTNITPTKSNKEIFDMFLAHGRPREVDSYDSRDFSELHLATDWLLSYFGLENVPIGNS